MFLKAEEKLSWENRILKGQLHLLYGTWNRIVFFLPFFNFLSVLYKIVQQLLSTI